MPLFLIGLVLFLGIHSVSILAPQWRDAQAARIGEGKWKSAYAVISALGLVLLAYGWSQARLSPVQLYTPPRGLRHLALLLMLPVFPMLLAAYLPGRIQTTLKHPMLAAVKLWAVAHLLANGTLNDVILFGAFLAWAVADRISLKRRVPHPVPSAPPRPYNDLVAILAGLAVYALTVLWLHRVVIGVSPLQLATG